MLKQKKIKTIIIAISCLLIAVAVIVPTVIFTLPQKGSSDVLKTTQKVEMGEDKTQVPSTDGGGSDPVVEPVYHDEGVDGSTLVATNGEYFDITPVVEDAETTDASSPMCEITGFLSGVGQARLKSSIKKVVIPKTITKTTGSISTSYEVIAVGEGVFVNCPQLEEIIFQSNVMYVGPLCAVDYQGGDTVNANLATSCPKLSRFSITEELKAGESFSTVDGVLYLKFDGINALIAYPMGKTNPVYIAPANVDTIGNGAFAGCNHLEEVILHDSITSIPTVLSAKLKKFIAPGVGSIEQSYGLFSSNMLEEVNLASYHGDWKNMMNTNSIKKATINGTSTINQVNFPNVEEIVICDSLVPYTEPVPISYIAIPSDNIMVPRSFSIQTYAFYGSRTLKKVVFAANSGVNGIGESAFAGCVNLQQFSWSTVYNDFTIGENAFRDCVSLEEFVCPSGVLLGSNQFNGCINLQNLVILNEDIIAILENGLVDGYGNPITPYECKTQIVNNLGIELSNNRLNFVTNSSVDQYISTISDGNDGSFYFYHIDEDDDGVFEKHTLFAYDGVETDIALPSVDDDGETIGDYGIGDMAFASRVDIQSVDIPACVNELGSGVFDGCVSLKTITIPENSKITKIGVHAFSNTRIESILLPAGLDVEDYITNSPLVDCYYLCEIINYSDIAPSFLLYVGAASYAEDALLISQCFDFKYLSDSDTTHYRYVSDGNGGEYVFYDLNVNTWDLDPETEPSDTIDLTILVEYTGTLADIVIPDYTIGASKVPLLIDSYVFINDLNLHSIKFPSSISQIAPFAFYNCVNLKSVVFEGDDDDPSMLNTIFKNAFENCAKLKTIVFPTVTPLSIHNYAFYESGLVYFDIPANVTLILEEGTPISYHHFGELRSVVRVVNHTAVAMADSNVYHIPAYALFNTNAEVLAIEGNNPIPEGDKMEFVSDGAGGLFIFHTTGTGENITKEFVCYSGDLAEVSLPEITALTTEGVAIGIYSIKGAVLPFWSDMFGFRSVTKLTIPKDVTFDTGIMYVVMSLPNCRTIVNKTETSIATTIASIPDMEESRPDNLMSMSMYGYSVAEYNDDATANAGNYQYYVYSPDENGGYYTLYATTAGNVTSIDLVSYKGTMSQIVLPGADSSFYSVPECTGEIIDFTNEEEDIVKFYIKGGVFANNGKITSVTIPKDYVSLGIPSDGTAMMSGCCFYNCTALEEVIFEANSRLSYIGDQVFAECMKLREISIPTTVRTIGSGEFANTFSKCVKLKKVNISSQSSLTAIGAHVFENCVNLAEFVIPKNVTTIGTSAFNNCFLLNTIYNNSEVELSSSHCGNIDSITVLGEDQYVQYEVFPDEYQIVYVPDGNGGYFEFLDCGTDKYLVNYVSNSSSDLLEVTLPGYYNNYYNSTDFNGEGVAKIENYSLAQNCLGESSNKVYSVVADSNVNAFELTAFKDNSKPEDRVYGVHLCMIYYGSMAEPIMDFELQCFVMARVNAPSSSVIRTISDGNGGNFVFVNMMGLEILMLYSGTMENVVLPAVSVVDPEGDSIMGSEESISTYLVWSSAFLNNTTMKSVNIPSHVALAFAPGVDPKVFINCTNLEKVIFSKDLYAQRFAPTLFVGCDKLTMIECDGTDNTNDSQFYAIDANGNPCTNNGVALMYREVVEGVATKYLVSVAPGVTKIVIPQGSVLESFIINSAVNDFPLYVYQNLVEVTMYEPHSLDGTNITRVNIIGNWADADIDAVLDSVGSLEYLVVCAQNDGSSIQWRSRVANKGLSIKISVTHIWNGKRYEPSSL